ncbi:hypothetical protein MMC09_000252, partial [Bachmanniomyces sp. S44760]|nr:hypothetical protein [Bachmanniomyces sp. S44760]
RVQYTDGQGVCHSQASVDFLADFSVEDAKVRVNQRMEKWGRLLGDRRLEYVEQHRKNQYARGKARVDADNLHQPEYEKVKLWEETQSAMQNHGTIQAEIPMAPKFPALHIP